MRPLANTVKIDAEITPAVIKISPINICPLLSLRFEERDKTTPPNASNIDVNFVTFNFTYFAEAALYAGCKQNNIPVKLWYKEGIKTELEADLPVSYTHLTLPTNREV